MIAGKIYLLIGDIVTQCLDYSCKQRRDEIINTWKDTCKHIKTQCFIQIYPDTDIERVNEVGENFLKYRTIKRFKAVPVLNSFNHIK